MINKSNIIKPVLIAAGLMGLAVGTQITNPGSNFKVWKGTTSSGMHYNITKYGVENLVVVMPGARIETGDFTGLDQLQDYNIQSNGKYVLRDEVYSAKANPGLDVQDGNQSVRDYWRKNSFPDTKLREEIIAEANDAIIVTGINKVFTDGSPDYTTAQAREKAKLALSKGFR